MRAGVGFTAVAVALSGADVGFAAAAVVVFGTGVGFAAVAAMPCCAVAMIAASFSAKALPAAPTPQTVNIRQMANTTEKAR